jgi:hypothetical protein
MGEEVAVPLNKHNLYRLDNRNFCSESQHILKDKDMKDHYMDRTHCYSLVVGVPVSVLVLHHNR